MKNMKYQYLKWNSVVVVFLYNNLSQPSSNVTKSISEKEFAPALMKR